MEQRVSFDKAIRTAEFVCPVCHGGAPKRGYLTARRVMADSAELFRCQECSALTYFPLPTPDYSNHTGSELALRDYVELNGGVNIHASQVFGMCSRPTGRLLDVGCGFGFGLDFAVRALGWEAVGFEPSNYGLEGARLLGVDIRPEFATFNQDPADRFDVVYCSEVLEHVEDPWSFLRLLASHVADDGILFLTTPNADRIVETTSGGELLALLSPGFHTTLLPPKAIAGMLAVLGFRSVAVDEKHPSTRVMASRVPLPTARRPGFKEAYAQWLEDMLARLQPQTPLHTGIAYRLYRHFCDNEDWAGADKWFDPRLVSVQPDLTGLETLADYANRFPLCVAPATHCRALHLLHHTGDYRAAAQHFRAAFQLCRKKIELDRSTSVFEEHLLYLAAYYEAVALNRAGQRHEASVALERVFAPEAMLPVPAGVLKRAESLRDELTA